MVKKLSCVSYGSLKRFPHTFTNITQNYLVHFSYVRYELLFFSREFKICKRGQAEHKGLSTT